MANRFIGRDLASARERRPGGGRCRWSEGRLAAPPPRTSRGPSRRVEDGSPGVSSQALDWLGRVRRHSRSASIFHRDTISAVSHPGGNGTPRQIGLHLGVRVAVRIPMSPLFAHETSAFSKGSRGSPLPDLRGTRSPNGRAAGDSGSRYSGCCTMRFFTCSDAKPRAKIAPSATVRFAVVSFSEAAT